MIAALIVIVIIQLLAIRERRQKARDTESDEVEVGSDDGKAEIVGHDKKKSYVVSEERTGSDEKSIGL